MTIDSCALCPRLCRARRGPDHGAGYCRMGADAVVARAAPHFWEEPCLSGTRGSGTVFFSGCPLGCAFCQNSEISHGRRGERVSPERLALIFDRLAEQGVHNLNLVTPTHFVPAILEALELRKNRLPVIWNTGGYERVETLRSLAGHVDVYLPDLKFFDPMLSARYAHAPDYFACASAALLEMARQAGPPRFDSQGMMVRGLLVRHLVLPGHSADSLKILDWFAQNLKDRALLSLMSQYLPRGRAAEFPEINRRLTSLEYGRVVKRAQELGLTNGYVQDRAAATEEYIPPFNGEGVGES